VARARWNIGDARHPPAKLALAIFLHGSEQEVSGDHGQGTSWDAERSIGVFKPYRSYMPSMVM
jgi:hypothetical protein